MAAVGGRVSDFLVVHGHYYQPPREDPYTGAVPVEPTAAPYHDWNERITAESYRPNGWARVLNEQGRIVSIVNNYGLMSFDVGPTLTQWLEDFAPDVLARMVAGDRTSRTAVAQPYHHVILPLSDPVDRLTELRWGRADFVYRFGREPAGIWLPETAIDVQTAADVAAEGFDFTLVMPHQVVDGGSVNVGRIGDLTLVVANGSLSHDVAFGVLDGSASEFIRRATAVAHNSELGLAMVATDGETFGHHHRHTERTMAYALGVAAPRAGLHTGSLEVWLEKRAGVDLPVVAVVPSAWSCAHGLGRWQSDCGCRNGDFEHADLSWRAPLRHGLDAVRAVVARVFEQFGRCHLVDPWAARDAYIAVILGTETLDAFMVRHLCEGGSSDVAHQLLQMQCHALAMYTSCAWFFDDIARLETVLVLKHAARCLHVLTALGHGDAADAGYQALFDHLAMVTSNDPNEGTGAQVWDRAYRNAPMPASVASSVADDQRSRALGIIDRAVTGEDGAVREALAWVSSASPAEISSAQETVFEALVDRSVASTLDEFGRALGLATGELRRF